MKIDSKKIFVIVLYIVLSIGFILMIPSLIGFSPSTVSESGLTGPSFWNTASGKGIIGIIQVIVGVFLSIMLVVMLAKMGGISGSLSNMKSGSKYSNQGSAREGTISELKGLTVPVNTTKKGDGGFTLSKNVRLSAEKSYEHVAIIGPTGSGKSTSFFIPCLLDADGTHSFVVTDPKGELCNLTSSYLKSIGMDVIKLDPLHPETNKFFYNPVLIAEDQTDIREVAQLILMNGSKSIEIAMGSSGGGSQTEWINMSIPLFTASLAYCKKHGKKKSINEAIDIILKYNLKEMDELFKKDDIAYRQFLIFKASSGSEKTMSSIKSVLTSNIQLFLDDKIETFTKTPFTMDTSTGKLVIDEKKIFHPDTLRKKPTALFICVEEVKSDYVAPLMSVFYSQLLSITSSSYTKEGHKTPILYMLDEFANIGVIPLIAKVAATARSRKIGLSIGIQGIEQLKRNYGDENAKDILNNLKTKLVFSGLVDESAQYISDLSGVTTVESVSYSIGENSGDNVLTSLLNRPNKQKSGVRREVLTPDEVRRLDENEVLIIAHNRNIVKDKKNTFYTQNKYKDKIKANTK